VGSVGIATRMRAGQGGVEVRLPGGEIDLFSVPYNARNDSSTLPCNLSSKKLR
jgi:hypothetical protein